MICCDSFLGIGIGVHNDAEKNARLWLVQEEDADLSSTGNANENDNQQSVYLANQAQFLTA